MAEGEALATLDFLPGSRSNSDRRRDSSVLRRRFGTAFLSVGQRRGRWLPESPPAGSFRAVVWQQHSGRSRGSTAALFPRPLFQPSLIFAGTACYASNHAGGALMTWIGWSAWAFVVVLILTPPRYDPAERLRLWLIERWGRKRADPPL